MIFLLALFLLFSCTDEPKYGGRELYSMAQEVDPTIELVPITDPAKRILCQNYGPGCIEGSGKRVKVRRVELIVVEFKDIKSAKAEALRLNQYYARNWLFDDVKGEPVLESFVKKVYQASNP